MSSGRDVATRGSVSACGGTRVCRGERPFSCPIHLHRALGAAAGWCTTLLLARGCSLVTILVYVCLLRYEWRGWVVLVMLAIIIFFRTAGNIGLLFINFQRR